MNFAVLHIEKCQPNTYALGGHINREIKPKNADPERTPLNRILVSHGKNLADTINKRVKEGYKGKTAIRKDAVKAITVVLSGSHEHMIDLEQRGKLNAWVSSNHYWLSEKYGQENIVSLALHMDESTPHLHAVIVPLTKDGRLCAKEVIGDRIEMKKTQTAYATLMDVFGMSRGKEGSRARHEDVKEYYKRINNELPEIRKISKELHEEVGNFSRLKGFKMGAEALVSRLTKKDPVKILEKANDQLRLENLNLERKTREQEKTINELNKDVDYYKRHNDEKAKEIAGFKQTLRNEIAAAVAIATRRLVGQINFFLEKHNLPEIKVMTPGTDNPGIHFAISRDKKNDLNR